MNVPLRRTLVCFLVAAAAGWAGTVEPATPVANPDSYQTGQGQTLTIGAPGVLGNDTDADLDALTAAAVNQPLNGTVAVNADGSFTYDPDDDFYGTDDFSYAASDGSTSDQAIVTVTVTSSYAGGGGGGGGYGAGGAPSPATLLLLGLAALYARGLKAPKRRAISP